MGEQNNPQNVVFKALDAVPGQVWYIAGVLSILASAYFQLTDRKQLALFVGQWPPTFFAVGIYHKLVRPGNEDPTGHPRPAGEIARERAGQISQQMGSRNG